MTATLKWNERPGDADQRVSIGSLDDLERLLDATTARAEHLGHPITVVLERRSGESLGMIVGHEKSLLTWIRENDDDVEVLSGHTQTSEAPKQRSTDVATARQVLRHYYSTGSRSDVVTWTSD